MAIAVVSAAGLAACTTTTAGTPAPPRGIPSTEATGEVPSSGEQPDDDLPSDGAPKVDTPLDAGRFEQDPCQALTSEQTQSLGMKAPGARSDDSFGNGCAWRNPETGGSVHLSFLSTDKRGLSSAYRSNDRGDFTYFEPLGDIEGHPAVAFDIRSDKPTAACSVAVGLTDQLVISILTNLSGNNIGQKDPCEVGAMVAGKMLQTMKGDS
jgi:hypothetical protein